MSSREKKRRADVYSRNIRPDIFCAAPPTGVRCRRTNDLMREGLETPDTVAANREMREGKRDTHDGRKCKRDGENTACAKTGFEPSDTAKYQWNFEREGKEVERERVACGTFHGHDLLSISLSLFLHIATPITSRVAINADVLFAIALILVYIIRSPQKD